MTFTMPGFGVLVLFALSVSAAACDGADAPEEEAREVEHVEDAEVGGRVVLTEAAAATAGIVVEVVTATGNGSGEALEVPAQVAFDPRRVALVSPRTSGRLERTLVVDGDRVSAGQTVALMFAPAYVAAQQEFAQAARRARLLDGSSDEQGSRALAEAAARRLRYLGAADAEIERLADGGEPRELLPLAAPIGGSIVETSALAGAAIDAGSPVYRVADLSVVDVLADIPERSLRMVAIGQSATIHVNAYPDRAFTGTVERIHDELDPETRSVHAVIHVANPTRTLRPGMFASVRLNVPTVGTGRAPAITIPETAVVADAAGRFVFVETGPLTYDRRDVRVTSLAPAGSAQSSSGRLAVWEGLRPGDRVVVQGAFTLKSELASAALADDDH